MGNFLTNIFKKKNYQDALIETLESKIKGLEHDKALLQSENLELKKILYPKLITANNSLYEQRQKPVTQGPLSGWQKQVWEASQDPDINNISDLAQKLNKSYNAIAKTITRIKEKGIHIDIKGSNHKQK